MIRSVLIVLAMLFFAYPSFGKDKFRVMVSILPQIEFVEQVGKEKVEVLAMIPKGASPEHFHPVPRLVKALGKADLYVRVGPLPFELQHLRKLYERNKAMLIVDTSKGASVLSFEEGTQFFDPGKDDFPQFMALEDDGHQHEHITKDPHMWLSVKHAIHSVRLITEAMIRLDPTNHAFYTRNRDEYTEKLKILDMKLMSLLSPLENRKFLVFHPSFGYLARDYGLSQISVKYRGKSPTAKQMKRLVDFARDEEIKVIFVQPQFSKSITTAVAGEVGASVEIIDPLEPNYLKNMTAFAERLAKVLSSK